MTADTNGKLYSSKTLQTYLNSFFTNVGGSGWANVQTQYCNGVLAGSTSCVGGTGFVTNPLHQLKGVRTDPTPVPDDIIAAGLAQNLVDDPIAQEAIRASAHFKYDAQATYIILTPPSTIATGHEYAEAVTDPDNFASDQDGWNDIQGSENGDKCAWMNTQNISLGGHAFAVQPLWSNEAFDATGNGCAVKRRSCARGGGSAGVPLRSCVGRATAGRS